MSICGLETSKKIVLKTKQLSMAWGYFHQYLIGSFPAYETLPNGTDTGLDVKSLDGTEYIEVKNKQNTMNSDIGKQVIKKLLEWKDGNPEKYPILIMINCKGKAPRYGAPKEIEVMNGKQGYEHISARKTFYDDLLETLKYIFKNFKTYKQLQESLVLTSQ